MFFRNKITLLVLVVGVTTAGWLSFSLVKNTANAYLYGYPLVLMDLTRRAMTSPESGFQENSFQHNREFPDHTFRNVVRPNNDTLYSVAWLDLSQGPLVLDVPDTAGRQYVIPLMDAWTNVFATVGKGSTGTEAGSYMIVGPDWKGDKEESLPVIQSPTNMVWIIGRIQTNGKADIPNVAAIQDQIYLTPLVNWLTGDRIVGMKQGVDKSAGKVDPYEQLSSMTPEEFFTSLSSLMARQYPLQQDAEMLDTLRGLGVEPGVDIDTDKWSFVKRRLMAFAVSSVQSTMEKRIEEGGPLENGWVVIRQNIGRYGDNYAIRAGIAMIGLGALPPEEAAYPNTKVDSGGDLLNGSHSYLLHFPKGETPPVEAFWSLTMYDEQGFLIDNPLGRYAIGDRDRLKYNEDGSLDILIQNSKPKNSENWLPAPKGDFAVTMRLYLPKSEFLDGQWNLPPIEKVEYTN